MKKAILFVLTFLFLSGCSEETTKGIVVTETKLVLLEKSNDSYAIELTLDQALKKNDKIRYDISFITNTGYRLQGQGILTNAGSTEPTRTHVLNPFSWIQGRPSRTASVEDDPYYQAYDQLKEEFKPKNIEELTVNLIEGATEPPSGDGKVYTFKFKDL